MIINLYKQHRLYDQALRLSEQHATHLISTVKREMAMLNQSNNYTQQITTGEAADESGFSQLRRDRPGSLINSQDLNKLTCEQIQDKLEEAQKRSNKEDEATYALMLSAKHVSMSNYVKALNVINRFNVLLVMNDTRKLILRISSKLFAMEDMKSLPDLVVWRSLRDTLLNVLTSRTAGMNELGDEIEKHLLVAHFLCLKHSMSNYLKQLADSSNRSKSSSVYNSLNELNLKLSIALLRYTDLVRADYLFYEAGQLCRQANRINFAFIFLNHFLDLVDAIQTQDVNLVDFTDLEQTDIPSKVPLPRKVFLFQGDHPSDAEKQIEQVKSWILEKSMDNSDYSLVHSQTNDFNANHANLNGSNSSNSSTYYEASLEQRANGSRSMACLVTGYPITDGEHFELKPGKYAANKTDWNSIIMIIKVSDSQF